MSSAPKVVDVVILDEDETAIAAVAVRAYLAMLRGTYRSNIRKGKEQYNPRCVEKYDDALGLYERLGGDPDRVLDIEEPAMTTNEEDR